MALKYRFLLIALGLMIFVVVSPVLILFARGYKINFKTWEIVKTGSLVIRTEPNRADIYLDDKIQESDTPATLRFLLPKDYNVTVSKDDYQSWTKRLNIQEEIVTWANLNREYITLFLKNPQRENTKLTQTVAQEPFHNRLVFVSDDKLYLVKTEGGDVEDIQENANWLNNKNNAQLLSQENLYYLLAMGRSLPFTPDEILNLKKIQAGDNRTVLLTGKTLTVLNRQNQITLMVPNVIDFVLENNDLWLIETSSLRLVNLNNNSPDLIRTALPLNNSGKLIRGDGRIFMIISNTLYVVSEKLDRIADGVAQAYWDNNSKQLIYGNDHEIFIFNPTSFRSDLILRSSSTVSNAVLNGQTGYVFFTNEGKIKAVEIDGRDHRNIYTITDAGSGFAITKDGKKLFVYDATSIKTYKIR